MSKIDELLVDISILLKNNCLLSEANYIEQLYKEALSYEGNYDIHFLMKIKSLYGGMGSFFDIVFTKNHKPLMNENIELNRLKNELYESILNLKYKV